MVVVVANVSVGVGVGAVDKLRLDYLLGHVGELGWVYQGRALNIFPIIIFNEFSLNFILKFRLLD